MKLDKDEDAFGISCETPEIQKSKSAKRYFYVDLRDGTSHFVEEDDLDVDRFKCDKILFRKIVDRSSWYFDESSDDRTFWISVFPITQGQWAHVFCAWDFEESSCESSMDSSVESSEDRMCWCPEFVTYDQVSWMGEDYRRGHPAMWYGVGKDIPVFYVSYDDIRGNCSDLRYPLRDAIGSRTFVGRLMDLAGEVGNFDLPTSAEWSRALGAEIQVLAKSPKGNPQGSTLLEKMWLRLKGLVGGRKRTLEIMNEHRRTYLKYIEEVNDYAKNAEDSSVDDFAVPVGLKKANQHGLYDMHGNVWEWCRDWYSEDGEKSNYTGMMTIRGGSVESSREECLTKSGFPPSESHHSIGFRIVCEHVDYDLIIDDSSES